MPKTKQDGSPGDENLEDLKGDSLEEAIAKLTPEQADMFMRALTLTMKKRRLMLAGTLSSLFVLVAGSVFAFGIFAIREPGSFMLWVFLVPFAASGFIMWLFGHLAKRAGALTQAALIESASK